MLLPPDKSRSPLDWKVVRAFLAGTVAGAASSAAAAWLASGFAEPLPRGLRVALLVAGALAVWATRSGPLAGRLALPEARRQIPAEVFGAGLGRGALRFGFELGTGVRTFVPSIAPYVLVLALVLARPTLAETALAALGFGVGRAGPLVALAATRARDALAAEAVEGPPERYSTATGLVALIGGLGLA